VIGEEPAGQRDGPDEIGRLGHFHVGSVGWESQGADAEGDDVRTLIGYCVEGDSLCDGVMHSALHEAVVGVGVLQVGHVVIWSGSGLLRGAGRCEK